MPTRIWLFLLVLFAGMAIAAEDRNLIVAENTVKRVALVIGNSAYTASPLKNPVNDARAMASRLRTLGFDVVLRENMKTKEIGSAYREFRSKIAPGSVALVFYAGHGIQFKGQNYFPAIDADIGSEEDVPLQSLNLGTLLDTMEESKAGVSLVFLDACRDNPFARRFRSSARGLAKVEAASGTLIHYATRPGSVADDGDGKNGTYTEALLTHINEAGVPVELLLKRVANSVVTKTSGRQEPWVEGSLRGDFYFIFQGSATIQMQPAADPESDYWNEVRASGMKEFFAAYLKEYPKGKYAALARLKLTEFEKHGRDAAPGPQPSNRIQPGISKSMNLAEYCNSKYGALAQVNNVRTDAYSWSCSIDGRAQAIDMADVCRVQHGNQYKPQVANPKDSYTWSCQ